LPSLSIGGTAGNTSIVNQSTAGNNYTVTAGLAIPLFNGFGREYAQKEAEADAQAAAARASSLKQQVVYQVFSSYYTLQTAARRVRSADDLLNSAEQSNDAALARYKAGVGGIIDLLTAQSALAAARAQQVQARWIWQTALAQLAHDAGALDVHGESNMKLAPADSGPPPHR
jgi:outer membrane protein TolC